MTEDQKKELMELPLSKIFYKGESGIKSGVVSVLFNGTAEEFQDSMGGMGLPLEEIDLFFWTVMKIKRLKKFPNITESITSTYIARIQEMGDLELLMEEALTASEDGFLASNTTFPGKQLKEFRNIVRGEFL